MAPVKARQFAAFSDDQVKKFRGNFEELKDNRPPERQVFTMGGMVMPPVDYSSKKASGVEPGGAGSSEYSGAMSPDQYDNPLIDANRAGSDKG